MVVRPHNLSVNRRFFYLENPIRSQNARIAVLENINQQLVNSNQQLETRIRSLDARIITLENYLQDEQNQTPQRLFGNLTFNFLENGKSRFVNRKFNKYIYCFIIINFLTDRQPFHLQQLRQLFMLYFESNLKQGEKHNFFKLLTAWLIIDHFYYKKSMQNLLTK